MNIKLHEAALNGVKFYIEASKTRGGRREKEFELIQTDRRQPQDLGKYLRVFEVKGVIQYNAVDSDSYYQSRDALLSVLEKKGTKTLTHPFYGDVRIRSGLYTLTEDIKRLGKADISFTASVVTEEINVPLPNPSNNPTKNDVKAKAKDALNQISKSNSEKFNIIRKLQDTYNEAKEKFITTLESLRKELGPIFSNLNDLASFIRQIEGDIGNISAFLKNPDSFFNEISQLIGGVDGAYTNAQGAFAGLSSLKNSSAGLLNSPSIVSTNKKIILDNNATAVSQLVRDSSAVMMHSAAVDLQYNTTDDVDRVRKVLYNALPTSGESYTLLDSLKSAMSDYLDNVEKSVKTIRIIDIGSNIMPLSVFCYRVYGSLDNLNLLVSVNDVKDVTSVTGKLKVVSDA